MKLFNKTHKNVYLFASGQALSIIGDSAETMALSWWILTATGSVADVAKITVPGIVLRLVLTPLIAPLTDKYPRKKVLVWSSFVKFVLFIGVAMLSWNTQINWPLLITLYIIASIAGAVFSAAAGGFVPSLVERKEIPDAMQKNSLLQSIGGICGGMIGGLVVSFAGISGAMTINAFSFLLSMLLIILININEQQKENQLLTIAESIKAWQADFYDGFRFFLKVPGLAASLLIICAINFFTSGLSILLPAIINAEKIGVKYLGLVETVGMIGSVSALLVAGFFTPKAHLKAQFCILFLIVSGISLYFISWVHILAVPPSAMFVAYAAIALFNMLLSGQIMMIVPDSHRGRVGAFLMTLSGAAVPLGLSAAGLISDKFSPAIAISVVSFGVVSAACLLIFVPGFSKLMTCSAEEAGKFSEGSLA